MLEKLGMSREGLLRQRVRKWGVFEDVVLMVILHDELERTERKCGLRHCEVACNDGAHGLESD